MVISDMKIYSIYSAIIRFSISLVVSFQFTRDLKLNSGTYKELKTITYTFKWCEPFR